MKSGSVKFLVKMKDYMSFTSKVEGTLANPISLPPDENGMTKFSVLSQASLYTHNHSCTFFNQSYE